VRLLGLERCFNGRIYGALDLAETNDKEKVIQRILDEHKLAGNELLVAGDGPVEIREAKRRKAIALGVASDEVNREGWNPKKVERLVKAGADFLVGDFSHTQELQVFLFNPATTSHFCNPSSNGLC
jgi:phosphoglycolate phosphatase-like HAD superfamily hydrolase